MWPDAFEALRRAAETVREEWGSARATAAAATEGETGVLAVAAPKFWTRAVAAALEEPAPRAVEQHTDRWLLRSISSPRSAVAVVDPALPAAAVAVPSVAAAATASVAAAAAPTVVVAVVFRCVTALVVPAVAADFSVVDVAAPRARRDAPSAVIRRRLRGLPSVGLAETAAAAAEGRCAPPARWALTSATAASPAALSSSCLPIASGSWLYRLSRACGGSPEVEARRCRWVR